MDSSSEISQPAKLSKKSQIIIGVTSAVVVVAVLIGVLSWYFTKSDGTSPPVVTKSKMLIGTVMAAPAAGSVLPLSKIIDDIDIFWDWKNAFTESLYDSVPLTKSNEKYIPMNWYFTKETVQSPQPYTVLLNYLNSAKPKYVFSWNEPDILGSWQGGNLTSSGAVIGGDDFPYGNATPNLTSVGDAKTNLTAYPGLATLLETQADDYKSNAPDVTVATPVMAVSAKIENVCAGFIPATGPACDNAKTINTGKLFTGGTATTEPFNTMGICTAKPTGNCATTEDYNGKPLYIDGSGCKSAITPDSAVCNGWLNLTKSLAPTDNKWWEKAGIINIHSYNRLAHMVKLHILEYMTLFADDLVQRDASGTVSRPGKEIWLTETACLYNDTDVANLTSVKVNANFLRDLLWKPTKLAAAQVTCSGHSDVTTSLPGLYTTDNFTFNGKPGSWYEHGFGAFTWFSDPSFASFATACFTDLASQNLNSDIFTNGEPNEIFDVLIGKNV